MFTCLLITSSISFFFLFFLDFGCAFRVVSRSHSFGCIGRTSVASQPHHGCTSVASRPHLGHSASVIFSYIFQSHLAVFFFFLARISDALFRCFSAAMWSFPTGILEMRHPTFAFLLLTVKQTRKKSRE